MAAGNRSGDRVNLPRRWGRGSRRHRRGPHGRVACNAMGFDSGRTGGRQPPPWRRKRAGSRGGRCSHLDRHAGPRVSAGRAAFPTASAASTGRNGMPDESGPAAALYRASFFAGRPAARINGAGAVRESSRLARIGVPAAARGMGLRALMVSLHLCSRTASPVVSLSNHGHDVAFHPPLRRVQGGVAAPEGLGLCRHPKKICSLSIWSIPVRSYEPNRPERRTGIKARTREKPMRSCDGQGDAGVRSGPDAAEEGLAPPWPSSR